MSGVSGHEATGERALLTAGPEGSGRAPFDRARPGRPGLRPLARRGAAAGAVLFAVLSLAGCRRSAGDADGGVPDGGHVRTSGLRGACDKIQGLSVCIDLDESAFALGEDFQRSACTGTQGTYHERGTCSAEEVLGSCDLGKGQLRRYYERGNHPHTLKSAREDCTRVKGKWSIQASQSDTL